MTGIGARAGLAVGTLDLLQLGLWLLSGGLADWATLDLWGAVLLVILPLCVGTASGAAVGALAGVLAGRAPATQLALLSPLCAGLGLYLAARPSLLRVWGTASYALALPIAALLLGALWLAQRVLRRVLTRQRPGRPWLALLLFAAGLACYGADALLYRQLYLPLHGVLSLGALSTVMVGIQLWRGPGRAQAQAQAQADRRPWLALGLFVVLLVGVDALLDRSWALRAAALHFTSLQDKVLQLARLPRRWLASGDAPTVERRQPATRPEIVRLRRRLGPRNASRPPHLLFFSLDAVRAQSLRPYGGPAVVPVLERLAREGLRFERAYAPGPHTIPTMLAWATAGLPTAGDVTTLYERLGRGGYQTVCLLPWSYLGPLLERDEPGCQWHRSLYRLEWVTAALEEVLREADPRRPLLLHAHVMEAHDPGRVPTVKAAYLRAIQRVDRALGQWLATLRRRGFVEHAVVVVSADHGESLGERGIYGHDSSLHDEQIRVPLIVWRPGASGAVERGPVSVGWLGQTLLALSGVVDERALRGPFLTASQPVRVHHGRLHAVIEGRMKLILDEARGTVRLYDLDADPGETENLVDRLPWVRARLLGFLR